MQYKAVFHIDQNEEFFLKITLENVANFYRQIPDADIRIVVNGPAVNLFRPDAVEPFLARLDELAGKGLVTLLCTNALAKFEIAHDILPAPVGVVQGGVVELTRLQHEGYAYIKP